jgi:hypothetical protein
VAGVDLPQWQCYINLSNRPFALTLLYYLGRNIALHVADREVAQMVPEYHL